MAALGSQSIASSYEQLLHVDADGGGNTTTHVSVKDGDNGTTFGFTIASDALMMSSTNRLEFGDTGSYIFQSADGVLDLVSDTEIEINATNIDINGAVDISGALGIGVASPAVGLDVHHDAEISAGFGRADDATNYISVRTAETQNNFAGLSFNVGSTTPTANQVASSAGIIRSKITNSGGALTSQMEFLVNTGDALTTAVTYENDADVTVEAGDIVFGAAGKGICLGVTSNTDANTLDDYEEGTWTPAMSGPSFSKAIGRYIKVGRIVRITAHLNCSNLNSTTGNMAITGLPFATQTGTDLDQTGGSSYINGWATGRSFNLYTTQNSSQVVAVYGSGTTSSTVQIEDMGTGYFWFDMTYISS